MTEDIYRVQLTDVFEGPMDLLVHLIKKNEVDIYDIPIAVITQQYLEYLEWMKSMNIEYAGDFIVMASTLTKIKSKMLLPVHVEDEEDDDDPRQEITGPLAEYLKMKSAAENLASRHLLGKDTFIRNPGLAEDWFGQETEMIKVGLFELIDAFQRILENMSPDQRLDLTADTISVKDKISQLVDILEIQKSATLDDLFAEAVDKSEVIVTFLAILEMVKLSLIRIVQHVPTGIIRVFHI